MQNEEYSIQREFTRYVKLKYPKLKFCASSGGLRTSMAQAIKNKLAGYSKGYPDIHFPLQKNGYAGLFIEIKKTKGGTKSAEQKEWVGYLNAQGYMAVFAHGLDECISILEGYLNGR